MPKEGLSSYNSNSIQKAYLLDTSNHKTSGGPSDKEQAQ